MKHLALEEKHPCFGGLNDKPFEWLNSRRFNAFSFHMKKRFGARVQKLSVDAGLSCPNRDGTIGFGGCTYCSNSAFNPSYCREVGPIAKQVEEGILFHRRRYRRAESYLVYFQAYTNTHADLQQLIPLYEEALAQPGIIGLVIGTRPDCLPDHLLEYLSKLAENKLILIELGVESIYDESLENVNRGHGFAQSRDAIERVRKAGLECGIHLIFGLPGETRQQMLASVHAVNNLPVNTIKFHQLQIYRDTPMAADYVSNPDKFRLFGLEEYIDFIIDYTERLNPAIVIERFAGEAPPNQLVSEPWGSLRYDAVLQMIEKRMEARDTWQGKHCLSRDVKN